MTISESDRIQAAGVPIVLADGRTVSLKYTMRSLKVLEDAFGSLAKMQKILEDDSEDRLVIGPLADVIAAGLIGFVANGDELLDLMDPRSLDDYSKAVSQAMDQAFPEPDENASPKANRAQKRASKSNGARSTTSPQLHSTEATVISGT